MNANKKKSMYFRREGATLNGKPLKLIVKMTYLGSNISSTEIYFNIYIAKAWTAVDRLSIICKSDLSDKIKRVPPPPSCHHVNTTVLMHHLDTNKMYKEKVHWELYKNAMFHFEQILEATFHKTAAEQQLTSHLKTHPNKICGTLVEKQG